MARQFSLRSLADLARVLTERDAAYVAQQKQARAERRQLGEALALVAEQQRQILARLDALGLGAVPETAATAAQLSEAELLERSA